MTLALKHPPVHPAPMKPAPKRAPVIRPARWGDKDALLEMIRALAQHHGDEPEIDMLSLIDLISAEVPWLHILVAEHNGALVGYAGLVRGVRLHHGQKIMDLHHLFVTPEARGQGVARALISESRAHAVTEGCAHLTVSTQEHNLRAQAAYEACGFAPQPQTSTRFSMDLS